jgi:hypothetical protein
MSEQIFQITLPSGIADAFVSSLEQILKEAGFEESLKAGEVGGVETSVWRRERAQVVVTIREAETEETVEVSAQDIDSAVFVKAAAARLALELLESLPNEIQQDLGPVLIQLREIATLSSQSG